MPALDLFLRQSRPIAINRVGIQNRGVTRVADYDRQQLSIGKFHVSTGTS